MNHILRDAKPIIILLAVCAALLGGIVWLNGSDERQEKTDEQVDTVLPPKAVEKLADYKVDITNDMNPIAVINTNKGVIEIELFENIMPITAGNFIKLAEKGFYDGVKFHRVIDGFMIQAGDPNTKTDEVFTYGTGGPGYTIPDEHVKSDLLTNVRGTISMANTVQPNSGGSQFFINLKDNQNLDFDKEPLTSKHPVFGRVISGMDVVDTIAKVETNATDLPLEDIVMESVTIRRGS